MKREIKKVAVLGSGVMGMGIAAHVASAGIDVVLLDIVPPELDKSDEAKGLTKESPAFRNKFPAGALTKALKAKQSPFMEKNDADRVTIGNFDDNLDLLKDCDWIIEVVVENLKIKKALFEKVKDVYNGDAIVSSNTSGIPIKDMAEAMPAEMKKNFLGTHFFNPVRFMHLLEIIPTGETDPDVVSDIAEFCSQVLGKGIVYAKDTPNFVGNRIGVAGMVKSMKLMLELGITINEADQIMGSPMGRPKSAMFRTADLVGIDTLVHIAKNTYDMVDKEEAEAYFTLPSFIEKMVEKGWLGNKTKQGFYKREEKKKFMIVNPETVDYEPKPKGKIDVLGMIAFEADPGKRIAKTIALEDKYGEFAWKAFADSCIYAAGLVPEIADQVIEIDNAMRWGYNFDLGPFEAWDAVGVEESVARMEKDGFTVPQNVKDMLAAGAKSFYKKEGLKLSQWDFQKKEYVVIEIDPDIMVINDLRAEEKRIVEHRNTATTFDIGDGVFLVEFHSPMNSLDNDMWDIMNNAVDRAKKEGVGVVIGNQMPGMPGAFSAGANISVVLQGAKEKQWDAIKQAVKYFQDTNQNMKYSSVPVVAAPYGLTLGGGAEVAMGSNMMVCHHDLFMGMVEVGVGLIPGGGGCMNLMKHYQNFIPQNAKILDLQPLVTPVFQMIATAKVSGSAAEARQIGFLRPWDKIIFNPRKLIGQAKKEVLAMAAAGFTPPKREKIQVMGTQLRGMANAILMNMTVGGYASDYDAFVARKLAHVLGGGDAPENGYVDEEYILELEREVFVELCAEEKTQQRLEHMLLTGRPLRN